MSIYAKGEFYTTEDDDSSTQYTIPKTQVTHQILLLHYTVKPV